MIQAVFDSPNRKNLAMLPKEFFENYPLYRKHPCAELPAIEKPLASFVPPITRSCLCCQDKTTWKPTTEYLMNLTLAAIDDRQILVATLFFPKHAGQMERHIVVTYKCEACTKDQVIFLVRFCGEPGAAFAMKVGQFPPWSIDISRPMARALGRYEQYYKNGLTCESQGYGIGAYGYYRRIVEGILDDLLASVTDLIPEGPDRETYKAKLQETREGRAAQDKCDLVKHLLPVVLTSDGPNPLGVLHHALSEGLHALEDERCLELSEEIRNTLEYLVETLEHHKAARKRFTDGMRRLLEKRETE